MSGHSKWATTKHKKAAVDARRGKLFAKLIKNVEVAARTGGGDPVGNPTLYDAVQKAKKNSVPRTSTCPLTASTHGALIKMARNGGPGGLAIPASTMSRSNEST